MSDPHWGFSLCDTEIMPPPPDPKSVKVNLTTGTGVDIEWKDGHRSHYLVPLPARCLSLRSL